MSFHDVRFPTDISYGSAGGPGFKTDIVALQSGSEHRVSKWSSARRMYDVSYGVKSYAQLANVQEFYLGREGSAHGFRFKDWLDYTSSTPGTLSPTFQDIQVGTASGFGTLQFQLVKRYTSGSTTFVRNITKPVANSVRVGVEGLSGTPVEIEASGTLHPDGNTITWSVNTTTGVLTVNTLFPSQIVYAGFEFDVPVRFADSNDEILQMRFDDFSSGSSRLELVELIGEDGSLSDDFFYGGSKQLGTISSDVSLSVQDGRVITFTPSASLLKLRLPYHGNPSVLPLGGPYFYLCNLSPTFNLNIYDSTGLTNIGTVNGGTQKTAILGLDASGAPRWYLAP